MPRRSLLFNQIDAFPLSPVFSNISALFFTLSEVEGLTPSSCEGCPRDLSPLLSVDCALFCALFCAMEPSQRFSYQGLAHSFPCNGGWACFSLFRSGFCPLNSAFSLGNSRQLTNRSKLSPHFDSLCFHRLTHCPICKSFVFSTIQQWGGCVGSLSPVDLTFFFNPLPSHATPASAACRCSLCFLELLNLRLLDLCLLSPRLSSLECTLPRSRALSALECAVTKTRRRKSFRMRSSEKRWGEGGARFRVSIFEFPTSGQTTP